MVRLYACAFLMFVPWLVGCGANTGEVQGKLTCKGEPVTAGSVIFFPVAPEGQFEAGKASATIPDEAGNFQFPAVIGKHNVRYTAPSVPQPLDDKELYAKRMAQWQKFGHMRLAENHTVEVKAGKNDVTLELTPGPKTAPVIDN